MVKKAYELQMNWSRLKKQLFWAVGTSMDEEAPYSDLVKLLVKQAYYYLKSEVRQLHITSLAYETSKEYVNIEDYDYGQYELELDDTLNEHPWEEQFPAYTLGRDPNTLDVIHRD
jgi:hypothetical protein